MPAPASHSLPTSYSEHELIAFYVTSTWKHHVALKAFIWPGPECRPWPLGVGGHHLERRVGPGGSLWRAPRAPTSLAWPRSLPLPHPAGHFVVVPHEGAKLSPRLRRTRIEGSTNA